MNIPAPNRCSYNHGVASLISSHVFIHSCNLGDIDLNTSVMVEISPGELIDKITILEIKMERIADEQKLKNIKSELRTLNRSKSAQLIQSAALDDFSAKLKAVNENLWIIEDDIREFERLKDFNEAFIKLARAVYVNNDERARIKRSINDFLGSKLIEEKSYASY